MHRVYPRSAPHGREVDHVCCQRPVHVCVLRAQAFREWRCKRQITEGIIHARPMVCSCLLLLRTVREVVRHGCGTSWAGGVGWAVGEGASTERDPSDDPTSVCHRRHHQCFRVQLSRCSDQREHRRRHHCMTRSPASCWQQQSLAQQVAFAQPIQGTCKALQLRELSQQVIMQVAGIATAWC